MESIYSNKSNPEKFLPFEITLEEALEKANTFLKNSAFEYKDYISNELYPIYLPFWMYDCTCEAEYISKNLVNRSIIIKDRGMYSIKTAKIDCEGILANSSIEMDNKLTDNLEPFFDLSKLEDFDTTYISNYNVKYCDVNFEDIKDRLHEKIKTEIFEKQLGFQNLSVSKKIDISQAKSTYIELPFYYAEIKGLKILINGQTGDISINSKDYLKTEKRLAFENILYGEKIQSNSNLIAFSGAIIILLAIIMIASNEYKIRSIFPNLFPAFSLLIVVVFLGYMKFINHKNKFKKYKYIKNIIYNNRKTLSIFDEIKLIKVNRHEAVFSIVQLIFGSLAIFIIIDTISLIISTYLSTLVNEFSIGLLITLGVLILIAIFRIVFIMVRCVLKLIAYYKQHYYL